MTRTWILLAAAACLDPRPPTGYAEPWATVTFPIAASWCHDGGEVEVALVSVSGAETTAGARCGDPAIVMPGVRYGRYDVFARVCVAGVGWWSELDLWVDHFAVEQPLSFSPEPRAAEVGCDLGVSASR